MIIGHLICYNIIKEQSNSFHKSLSDRKVDVMSNNSNGFNNNAYHDSHCEGPYCNCDSRRYGYSPKSSSMDWLWVVAYMVIGLICPPLGAIIMLIWLFH